ncbi:hypothetical protein, partial [Clostridium puniceum]
YIYLQMAGSYRTPQGGILYLEVEIPEGKTLKSIDVTVTPNIPVYEDREKTELQLTREKIETIENYILEQEKNKTINGGM